jgi:guanosine-3',5'-bis(diphosphate) 3'-pyrophosphohydrolase
MHDKAVLWRKAAGFAARKHDGQLRKDNETPYIAHPFRVAMTVRDIFGVDDSTALAAALLHDVIEDTTADYDDLEKEFTREIAEVVAALTKDMRMPEDAREVAYDKQLTNAPWQARLVKLADVYDNLIDCLDPRMTAKAIKKAERAITCAGKEPLLDHAVKEVKTLIKKARK